MIKTIITFIFVFGVIVLVHEFGHYYFAKKSGILVREFAIGMGPKLIATRKNGTAYTIRLLPIGGYVRMAGAGDDDTVLVPGQSVGLVLTDEGLVKKINTSKKVNLIHALPLEVTQADLEKELFIEGYTFDGSGEQMLKRFDVLHDATIIEENGVEIQIAPLDVQFQSASLKDRMLTNFAGPLNNFILAILLFILIAFLQGGKPVVEQGMPVSTNEISFVEPDSPAAKSGIHAGDYLVAVDEQPMQNPQKLAEVLQKKEGAPVKLTLKNKEGKEKNVTVTPKKEVIETEDTQQDIWRIGIAYAPKIQKLSFFGKIGYGLQAFLSASTAIIVALKGLITGFSLNKLGGPVMIFEVSSQVAQQGFITVLSFMGLLSVNLGIMNLLPIPALDGGKLVLNIIEGVRGKPLSEDKEGIITLIGFAILMVLMILVTWNDIQRFLMK